MLRAFCSLQATPTQHHKLTMLFYTEALTAALNDRFDDIDEIRDIATHGCEGGVSGFIFYKDTREFFEKYEDDIEDVCYDILGIDYLQQLSKGETCILGLINALVWFTVQAYCQTVVNERDTLHDEEMAELAPTMAELV